MTVARVSFAESALSDLAGIQEWYAEEGVPEVGDRLVAEIFQRVEVLADHPDIGRIVPEFDQGTIGEGTIGKDNWEGTIGRDNWRDNWGQCGLAMSRSLVGATPGQLGRTIEDNWEDNWEDN
jgi:plasmid stabilization system protein ParE